MKRPNPYASTTEVPVTRSRSQIDRLLRRFEVTGIQWTDELPVDGDRGRVTLRFRWLFEGAEYVARFDLPIPDWREVVNSYKQRPTTAQVQKRLDQRVRMLHRLLLLKIRADLHAVEEGLVNAVEVFLPHLEGRDGRTVAEVAVPRLRELGASGARALLEDRST